MRAYRILYRAAMACALLWGLYSGNRFSWLLFLILAMVLLAALGVNLWTACSFSYLQELSAPQGEKGQTIGLHIGIYNDKPFPFTRMRVTVEAPDPAETQILAIDLAPKADCSFDLRLSLPCRGEFLVGMTRLDLQDMFGLLPMHFDLRRLPYYRQRPLLVLPRVRECGIPMGRRRGTWESGSSGSGTGQEELAYLRGWTPGDRLARMHWAATAKTRTMVSRQYEDPAGGSALVFLDCRSLNDRQADRLAECAATLLYVHLRQGDAVALRCSHPQARPLERAFSITELPRLREWLALLKFDQTVSGDEPLAEVLLQGGYSRVYLLGGRFDPKLLRLGMETAAWYYWVMEPLAPGVGSSYRHKLASIGQKDVAEFLSEQLREEP